MIQMTKNSQVVYKYKFGEGDIKNSRGERGEVEGEGEREMRKKIEERNSSCIGHGPSVLFLLLLLLLLLLLFDSLAFLFNFYPPILNLSYSNGPKPGGRAR